MNIEIDNNKLKDCTPVRRTALTLLKGAIKQLINGECTDEEISYTISSLSPTTNGYFNPDNYITVDKGMKLLGICSRNEFTKIMKQNNITCEYSNNVRIGYPKDKILILRNKLKLDKKNN